MVNHQNREMNQFSKEFKAILKLIDSINNNSSVKFLLNQFISFLNKELLISKIALLYNTKSSRTLNYINAGHNPPVLYNSKTKKTTLLENGCLGIGMIEEITDVEATIITIPENSKLICFTDGISEANTNMNIEFGHSNFEPFLNKSDSISDSVNHILSYYKEMVPEENIFDDSTILGIEFK